MRRSKRVLRRSGRKVTRQVAHVLHGALDTLDDVCRCTHFQLAEYGNAKFVKVDSAILIVIHVVEQLS